MPSDTEEVIVKQEKKISSVDFDSVADFIEKEYKRRKKARKWLDDKMIIIDRQLRMEPDVKYKKNQDGDPIQSRKWMPEIELPNQSQTLETLSADVNRLVFPSEDSFFRAKAYAPDQFLQYFKENSDFVVGVENDQPSTITQDNIDKYVEGFTSHILGNFGHEEAWKLIINEALKYSKGVGRVRMAVKSIFVHEASVSYSETKKVPILVPIPLKNVYFDDKVYEYMANGAVVGPSVIMYQRRRLVDLQLEAKRDAEKKMPTKDSEKGEKMPDKESNDHESEEYLKQFMGGGWLTKNLYGIKPDNDGYVELLEYEGDMVFPLDGDETENIFVPNVVVTAMLCKQDDKKVSRIVRIQYNDMPVSSYIVVDYQKEHIDSAYGTSPLLKGLPIQTVASESLNRFMQSSILSTEPPIQYDRDDQFFMNNGGPKIFPSAQWASNGDIKVHEIGNPQPMLAGYQLLLSQYADVTGVNAPRLGAQTVSHTTAFSKEQEIERGMIRTIAFVQEILKTPMTRWLTLAYYLGRKSLGDDVAQVYMDSYKTYVNVRKDLLPALACFEPIGATAPRDNMARQQARNSAMLMAVQLNQVAAQAGLAQPLNYDAIVRNLLRDAGVTDVDSITTIPQGVTLPPAIQGADQGVGGANPNALTVALQGLQQGIGG